MDETVSLAAAVYGVVISFIRFASGTCPRCECLCRFFERPANDPGKVPRFRNRLKRHRVDRYRLTEGVRSRPRAVTENVCDWTYDFAGKTITLYWTFSIHSARDFRRRRGWRCRDFRNDMRSHTFSLKAQAGSRKPFCADKLNEMLPFTCSVLLARL